MVYSFENKTIRKREFEADHYMCSKVDQVDPIALMRLGYLSKITHRGLDRLDDHIQLTLFSQKSDYHLAMIFDLGAKGDHLRVVEELSEKSGFNQKVNDYVDTGFVSYAAGQRVS